LMVLDDAHAVFPTPEVDPGVVCLRVGTLSKTLGSQGGFVSGPVRWIELLINRARPFIFSTGLAPAAAGAARAALEVWRSAEGSTLVSRLRAHVETVRPGHASPIVPLILGSEEAALAASNRLLEAGFLVPAIRPPTVPEGTSRLRLSLSAAHLEEDVALLVRTLRSL
jgi:8-amino-7-oxononanoate synthase